MFLNLSPPSYFETNVLGFLSFKSWISLSTVYYGFILVQHPPIDNFFTMVFPGIAQTVVGLQYSWREQRILKLYTLSRGQWGLITTPKQKSKSEKLKSVMLKWTELQHFKGAR